MKKIFVLLILMILLITGCGNKELNSLDLNEASSVIENTLKDMVVVEAQTLEDVYDLDLSNVSEYVIKQNSDGDLYAIIKTENKVDMKEDMDEYFGKIKEFNEAYSPERLEILENRLEKEIGDYLIYIVAEDAEAIYNDVISVVE